MSPLLNPGLSVLSNPLLLDSFNVIRRVETVNNSGEAVLSLTATTNVSGVVKPIGDRLDRKSDQDSSQKDLRIFTRFALRGEARDGVPTNWKPDLVFWHGNNFIVKNVRDWGGYGAGYVAAECNSLELVSMPPQVNSGLGNSGTLAPFGGSVTAYSPTIIDSIHASMPVNVAAQNMVLFKNSQNLITPEQFTVANQVITFIVPLVAGDELVFYA